MALETVIEKLITAVEANTAAFNSYLAANGGSVPKAGPATKTTVPITPVPKPVTKAATAPGIDAETLKASAVKVMDTLGKPFAKKLIKEVGGADALPAVKKEKYAALHRALEKALEDAENGGDEEEAAAEEDDEL